MNWNETTLNKILLVEDDPVHARIMRKAFEESPRHDQIIHFSDGESVIQALFPHATNDLNDLHASRAPGPNLPTASNKADESAASAKDVAAALRPDSQENDEINDKLPSLILLDLRLPTVDGFEVLQAIRSNERTRKIPVIVVSTSERQGDIQHCYWLGANAYITKPIDYNIFIEKLRALRQFWLVSAELPDNGE